MLGITAGISSTTRYRVAAVRLPTRSTRIASSSGKTMVPGRNIMVNQAALPSPAHSSGSRIAST